MRRSRLNWIIITSPFLIFFISYLALKYMEEARQVKFAKKGLLISRAALEITGFSFSEYFAGAKKMELKAQSAVVRQKTFGFLKTPLVKEMHLEKPDITFFSDKEEVVHIIADIGRMNMSNKRLFLKGSVILNATGGKSLTADGMALDPAHNLLSINGKFRLNKNGEIIDGRGLRSDIELERVVIKDFS